MLLFALSQAPAPAPMNVARGSNSGVDEHREVVVRTLAEWESLWKEHGGQAPAPTVDFSQEMVAAVFLGSRPTGGYRVDIVSTRRDGEALIVEYRERQPGRGDIVTQVLTMPFHIVKLPQHAGPVRFSRL